MNRFSTEFRAEITGDRLAGHAAVYNRHAKISGHYEAMAPTAFHRALERDDVRALINHDPSKLLARSKAGTLKLSTDSTGLYFEIEKLPNTSYANDLRELVTRGDLDGMSFGFVPGEDTWSRAPDGTQIRTHQSVESLLDVSVVTYPAYDGTDVALRAIEFTVPDQRTQLIRIRHRLTRSTA